MAPNPPTKQDQLINLLKRKVMEISNRHKKIVGELKNRLRDEMAKKSEAEMQLNALRKQLEGEMAKGNQLAAELEGKGGARVDIEKLKNAAYAEAQISSLTENLKSEIARNATLEKNFKLELIKNEQIQKDHESRLASLQEELAKGKEANEMGSSKFKEQVNVLSVETQEQKKKIALLEGHLADRGKDISQLRQDVSGLEQKAITDHQNFEQTIQDKKDERARLEESMAILQDERDELFNITRTYDLISLHDKIQAIKSVVEKIDHSGKQKELKATLDEVLETISLTNKIDDKVKEMLSNFHNINSELEQKLKNQIVFTS
ncbi:MAG: hypothetical protein WCG27_04315 [Pseudomonadota bacterium]